MHIFISYSRGTPYMAESIKDLLERHGYKVWLDLDDIQGGTLWEKKIFEAIEKSSCVVVIVTKQALESTWIPKEIVFSKQLNRDIVPIILERLESVEEACDKLEIDSYQRIDFVAQRKAFAEEKFLAAIAHAKQRWEGTIRYIDGIKSKNVKSQKFAMLSVSDIGEKAADFSDYIIPLLKSDDWDIRLTAAQTLSSIGDSRIVNNLIEFIKDSFEEYNKIEEKRGKISIQEWMAFNTVAMISAIEVSIDTLGRLGGLSAAKYLRELAKQKQPQAIVSLGRMRDIESIDLFAKLIKDAYIDWSSTYRNPTIIFACVWALGYINTENAAKPLIYCLEAFMVEKKNGTDLYESTLVSGIGNDDAYYLWPELALHYLADEFLEDEYISVVAAAALVLGKLGNFAASKTLLNLLWLTMPDPTSEEDDEGDGLLPHAAALGLGLLGDTSVLKDLEEALQKCDEQPLSNYISEAIRLLREEAVS